MFSDGCVDVVLITVKLMPTETDFEQFKEKICSALAHALVGTRNLLPSALKKWRDFYFKK